MLNSTKHNTWQVSVTCFVTQVFMGFAVLSHPKVNGFQRSVLVLAQVQKVLRLDIPDEHIASMTLGHRPQNLTH